MRRIAISVVAGVGLLTGVSASAQVMGTVRTQDAQVSGGLEVSGDTVRLMTNASVVARDHTASIALDRGGEVAVCATSEFRLLRSGTGKSLLFALNRGAMEIRSHAETQDSVVTPDLRFTLLTPGVLDLRIRVTREGDTCVENRGAGAPVVQVAESFSDAQYHLAPGQHVLFEHGSVREVVDNERSNCGCPAATPAMVASTNPNGTSTVTPEQTAAMHPFPEAQSQGLAETKPTVPLPTTSAESAALSYTPAEGTKEAAPAVAPAAAPTPSVGSAKGSGNGPAEPPPAPPGAHDIFRSIGHFFKRLFGGK